MQFFNATKNKKLKWKECRYKLPKVGSDLSQASLKSTCRLWSRIVPLEPLVCKLLFMLLLQPCIYLCQVLLMVLSPLLMLEMPLVRNLLSNVFRILPVHVSSPPIRVLRLSMEIDQCGAIGSGTPSKSEESGRHYEPWAHVSGSDSCHLDPPAMYGYGVWSQPDWYLGTNPGTCPVDVHPAGYIVVCGWELDSASLLTLLHVALPET